MVYHLQIEDVPSNEAGRLCRRLATLNATIRIAGGIPHYLLKNDTPASTLSDIRIDTSWTPQKLSTWINETGVPFKKITFSFSPIKIEKLLKPKR